MNNIMISKKTLKFSFIISAITTLILLIISFQTNAKSNILEFNKKLTKQQKLFLKVEKDLNKGKVHSFIINEKQLKDYILYPYLLYQDIQNRMEYISLHEISAFLRNYGDTNLAPKLKVKWLHSQAEKKNWRNFINLYTPSKDLSLQCHYINAKLKLYPSKRLYKNITDIWISGQSLPTACDPIFKDWETKGYKTKKIIWKRIKLAINKKNYKLARYLAQDLNWNENKIVTLWIKTKQKPSLIHNLHTYKKPHHAYSEIITHAVIQIAKTKPQEALRLWKEYDKYMNFKKSHWNLITKAIGQSLITKGHTKAAKWLEKLPDKYASEELYNIKLKCALIQQNWKLLAKIIKKLPKKLALEDKWQYWKARAYSETGKHELSQKILTNISSKRNYYGLISSLRILKPFSVKSKIFNLTKEEIDKVTKSPAIARAIELYKIGKTLEANTEWFHAIIRFNEKQKQAAAYLANQLNISNWSIVALAHADNKDDLNLRFPLNYSRHIIKEAKINKIDPAWIFAITRQESAFIPNARSRAGALGLMQLIPSTGKMVAKMENLKLRSSCDLLKADKNIKLGSKYLQMMLERYNQNHILAIAAYNAGPRRVEEWLPKNNMEADVWIEIIPFKETRNYVKNVLTYTAIYQLLLNKNQKISLNLTNVKPRFAFYKL